MFLLHEMQCDTEFGTILKTHCKMLLLGRWSQTSENDIFVMLQQDPRLVYSMMSSFLIFSFTKFKRQFSGSASEKCTFSSEPSPESLHQGGFTFMQGA